MLCDHPKGGLLWRTLQKGHLSWLMEVIPEDTRQEAALFLVGWTPEAVDTDPKGFFRAASHHFYRVAVNYGFRRPTHAGYYVQQAKRLKPLEGAEEDGYEKKVAITNWHSQDSKDSLWFQEHLELCKRILLSSNTGKTDWYLFQGYLSGLNLNEIAFLTFGDVDPKQVKKRLKEIICRIREAAGVDPDLPMPPMPKKGNVEFRQDRLVGAGSRPVRGKPRRIIADPQALSNFPLNKIVEELGVSKSTASRLRRRGWYCPDYHKDSDSIKGIASRLGISQTTVSYRCRKARIQSILD